MCSSSYSTSPYSPSGNLGLFINEFYEKTTRILGQLENFIVTKINDYKSVNLNFQKTLNKIENNKELLLHIICYVGAAYNFWKNQAFFLAGTLIGCIASTPDSNLETLKNNELLPESYFAAKVMTTLSALNSTSKNSAPFSFVSGFMLGNSFYHHIIKSTSNDVQHQGYVLGSSTDHYNRY
jgi:hypothetical protein